MGTTIVAYSYVVLEGWNETGKGSSSESGMERYLCYYTGFRFKSNRG